jgi:hypothetical protein
LLAFGEHMQRHIPMSRFAASGLFVLLAAAFLAAAQTNTTLTPTPKAVTVAQLKSISAFEGQLVNIAASVVHTDSGQVFTIGEKQGPQVHVLVPRPAIDAANVAETVAITGFIRRFDAGEFERDYSWFRRADYPDVKGGEWLIVATSVTTPEGTQLVPPGVISETAPAGKAP